VLSCRGLQDSGRKDERGERCLRTSIAQKIAGGGGKEAACRENGRRGPDSRKEKSLRVPEYRPRTNRRKGRCASPQGARGAEESPDSPGKESSEKEISCHRNALSGKLWSGS